jgi:hypothetical protein
MSEDTSFLKKLDEQGFQAYKHKDHGDIIFWSQTDLISVDDSKSWYLV